MLLPNEKKLFLGGGAFLTPVATAALFAAVAAPAWSKQAEITTKDDLNGRKIKYLAQGNIAAGSAVLLAKSRMTSRRQEDEQDLNSTVRS